MIAYLELMEVWRRENDRGGVLCLVSDIKVSVASSYVMGKCRTDVIVSVFCDAKGSMDSQHDKGWPRDNAASFYFF